MTKNIFKYFIILLFSLGFSKAYDFGTSIICTSNSPKQYFNFPRLTNCNFNYKNTTEFVKYEIFKPNTIEFISKAHLCRKVVTEVSMYTDISGYEHLIEKDINNKEITYKEWDLVGLSIMDSVSFQYLLRFNH